jgi:hypothetical protein
VSNNKEKNEHEKPLDYAHRSRAVRLFAWCENAERGSVALVENWDVVESRIPIFELDVILFVEIILIVVVIGMYFGVRMERVRSREDYLYLMRAREAENKAKSNESN